MHTYCYLTEGGQIKASLHMGETDQHVFSGDDLNYNQWHTLRYERRGKIVELAVDDNRPVIGENVYKTVYIDSFY